MVKRIFRKSLLSLLLSCCLACACVLPALAAPVELEISAVYASSTREDSKHRDKNGRPFTYPADYLIDDDVNTCWTPALIESVAGNGIGEYVDFYLADPCVVEGFSIVNGYGKSRDLYFANSRPAELQVYCQSGFTLFDMGTAKLKDTYDTDFQVFTSDERSQFLVTMVRIQIEDIYAGSKYPGDICISEIRILGYPKAR